MEWKAIQERLCSGLLIQFFADKNQFAKHSSEALIKGCFKGWEALKVLYSSPSYIFEKQ